MANVPEQLLDILEELGKSDLKKFQWHLTNGVEGFRHIPKAQMENADRQDTVDKIVQCYSFSQAVEITLVILKKINHNQLADELRAKIRHRTIAPSAVMLLDHSRQHSDEAVCTVMVDRNKAVLSLPLVQAIASTVQPGHCTPALTEDAMRELESKQLKSISKGQYATLYEGTAGKGSHRDFNEIYTELYIVKNGTGRINVDHEIIQMETRPTRRDTADTPVTVNDIFSSGSNRKKVLTLGIAGIGKTVSAQKFVLDWAEGKSNTHIDFIFLIPFRKLNLLKEEKYSLPGLLYYLYPSLRHLKETGFFEDMCRSVFIFDGLDEMRKKLNFEEKMITDITEKASVSALVTNLITGTLLPSAFVWITSRPAAADQIPLDYIHLVTEVRGFVTDQQKEQYFRKKITDQDQASRIISHIKQLTTIHIMCYIPVFCWITATVFQQIMDECNVAPKSLTEMYIQFLIFQMNLKNKKCNKTHQKDTKRLLESDRDMILKLSELSFKQLMRGNMLFYEDDLRECGIDVMEASVYSGICTEIFKEESVLYQRKIYCFIHLSFQEFLAALYVFHCYVNQNLEALADYGPNDRIWSRKWHDNIPLEDLLRETVYAATWSKNGHLDLFLRFLLGISLESNQRLLQGLLTYIHRSSESINIAAKDIKSTIEGGHHSTERAINLFLCLTEINDQSLSREIHEYLQSETQSQYELSPAHCSTIAYMLQMSEEVLNELDLKKFNTSDKGYIRLIPAVSNCRKALLADFELTTNCTETICNTLESANSPLRELELNNIILQDSQQKLFSKALRISHCKLKILKLILCNLGPKTCETLGSVLQMSDCQLRELDLSNNDLQDTGVELLSAGLKSSHCKLKILKLSLCNLGPKTCETLGSVLQMSDCQLRELDLSNNDLQDTGVELLSAGLKSSHCKLEILRLSGCSITREGCLSLAEALSSNPSYLKELDLTYNHPGYSGVKLLTARLLDCKLETLNLEHGGKVRMKRNLHKYACELTMDLTTVHKRLSLSEGNTMVTYSSRKQPYFFQPERFDVYMQLLCTERLCGRCYWEVEWSGAAAIAVAYKGISRKGHGYACKFGYNENSWSLYCSKFKYSVHWNNKESIIHVTPSSFTRIGVYLDWSAGTLSFYGVSCDTHTLTHLHTFHSTFTEVLYAGFGFWDSISSVCLCQIE